MKRIITSMAALFGLMLLISMSAEGCNNASSVNIDGTYEGTANNVTSQFKLKRESNNKVTGTVLRKFDSKFIKIGKITGNLEDRAGMVILAYTLETTLEGLSTEDQKIVLEETKKTATTQLSSLNSLPLSPEQRKKVKKQLEEIVVNPKSAFGKKVPGELKVKDNGAVLEDSMGNKLKKK